MNEDIIHFENLIGLNFTMTKKDYFNYKIAMCLFLIGLIGIGGYIGWNIWISIPK